MTAPQIDAIQRLAQCTFLPGSYEKRFVRDLAQRVQDDPAYVLSDKQRAFLAKLVFRYRRQQGLSDWGARGIALKVLAVEEGQQVGTTNGE